MNMERWYLKEMEGDRHKNASVVHVIQFVMVYSLRQFLLTAHWLRSYI